MTRSGKLQRHPGEQLLPSQRDAVKRQEVCYLPTLFDRLCDDAPSEQSETASACTPNRAQMRVILQRDLEFLLNTTNQSDLLDVHRYPEVAKSCANFGVPHLTGGYLSEKKWHDIESMIHNAIQIFEPRIISETLIVRPILNERAAAQYNVLTFEISGLVHMRPYPIEFIVQSIVDLETHRVELEHRPRE
ncbi:type VI secretion system protein ImpF [Oxalobacteraceae bacterium GrIS 2.11]